MAWDLDPDLALHTRLSFGRHAVLVAAVVLTGLGLAVTVAGAPATEFLPLVAGVSLAALVMSLPFGAIHILTLERDGRLDQQRLSGRSDARLAVVLFGGASGMLFLVGVPALMLGQYLDMSAMQVAALVVIAGSAANILIVVPRLSEAPTPVLAGMAVLFTAVSIGVVALLPSAVRLLMLIGTVVWISTAPFLLARMRRPAVAVRRRSKAILGPLLRMGTTRLPEFTRGLLSNARWWWMLAALIAVPLMLLPANERRELQFGREGLSGPLLYVALVAAALDASGRARRERVIDGLDRICLSGQRRWSVVLQVVASYGVPYLVLSAAAVAPRIWLQPRLAWFLGPWPLYALAMSSVGVAEGVRGRRLAVYVLPAAIAWIVALNGNHGGTWWIMPGAMWIPLTIAAQCLERPDGPPIPPWLVPLAAATFAATTASLFVDTRSIDHRGSEMFVAGWMSLAAGLLLPDRGPRVTPGRLAAAALACGVAAGLTRYFAFDPGIIRYNFAKAVIPPLQWPSTSSAMEGVLAACGLTYGWLAHVRFAPRGSASLLARLVPVLLSLVLVPMARSIDGSVSHITHLTFPAVLVAAGAAMWLIPVGRRYARTQS